MKKREGTDSTINRLKVDLGLIVRKAGLLAVFLFPWWGLLMIDIGGGGFYFPDNPLLNALAALWILSVMIPLLPGTGILAALAGALSRDKLVAFLAGFLPNILTGLMLFTSNLQGRTIFYSDPSIPPLGTVTILLGAVGFGLMGLGGAFYGVWRVKPEAGLGKFRLALAVGILGLVLWFVAFWVWPHWTAAFPGFGR